MLGGLHTLELWNCPNITDDAVKMLGGLHTLKLENCQNITEKCKLLLKENGVSIT